MQLSAVSVLTAQRAWPAACHARLSRIARASPTSIAIATKIVAMVGNHAASKNPAAVVIVSLIELTMVSP